MRHLFKKLHFSSRVASKVYTVQNDIADWHSPPLTYFGETERNFWYPILWCNPLDLYALGPVMIQHVYCFLVESYPYKPFIYTAHVLMVVHKWLWPQKIPWPLGLADTHFELDQVNTVSNPVSWITAIEVNAFSSRALFWCNSTFFCFPLFWRPPPVMLVLNYCSRSLLV